MTNARAVWDSEQIDRAVEFTTSRFLGRGHYDTRRFDTRAAAEDDARGDRRAMVYAVTPEGWSIHICNGDTLPMETTMTEITKTYSSKSNAIRAARAALKGKHRDPLAGVHFRIEPTGDEFAWHEIDLGTGQVAAGELLEDGAQENPNPPLAPVQQVPAKETRDEKRRRMIREADARNAAKAAQKAAERAARAAAPKAPRAASTAKPGPKKAEALAAAQRGELPTPPDFSADTHKRFRKTLEQLVAFAAAGDLKGLKADKTEPVSSSRSAMCRYRDLAIVALEARAKQLKAA